MVGAITPSDRKLVSKGVKSVRQRIALLKDYTDLTLEEFKDFVRRNLCQEELTLGEQDIRAIEEIEKEYLSDAFIFGKNPAYSVVNRQRIEGVGELEVRMQVKGNHIRDINLMGDFFLVGDLDNCLLKPLIGVELKEEKVREVIPERLEDIILNLKRDEFVSLIINNKPYKL